MRGRGSLCHAGGIWVTAEQDRALWWQGHVGRHRESTVLAPSAAWPWLLLEVWLFCFNDEGSGQKVSGHSSLHHETAAVHFHLWASASHLSATNNVSVLSLKCLRALQWMALEPGSGRHPFLPLKKISLNWSLLREKWFCLRITMVWAFAVVRLFKWVWILVCSSGSKGCFVTNTPPRQFPHSSQAFQIS